MDMGDVEWACLHQWAWHMGAGMSTECHGRGESEGRTRSGWTRGGRERRALPLFSPPAPPRLSLYHTPPAAERIWIG